MPAIGCDMVGDHQYPTKRHRGIRTVHHGDCATARATDGRGGDTADDIVHDDRDRAFNDINNPHWNRRF